MANIDNCLNVKRLSKNYGAKKVLNDVSITLNYGETVALIGANGAGKSTFIKALLGLVNSTYEELSFFGQEHRLNQNYLKKVGYLPEVSGFWSELSAQALLSYMSRLKGVESIVVPKRTKTLLQAFGLWKRSQGIMGSYSKGMLQRSGLAQTLINDPDFIILDEPMSGLDPRAQENLRHVVSQLKKRGKTILISSHSLGDVQQLCDRVLVLENGSLILDGKTKDVLVQVQQKYQNNEPWDEDPIVTWNGQL